LVWWAGFAFGLEAFFEFFDILFVIFEIFAEVAATAVDAISGRLADGFLGRKRAANGVFANFAEGLTELVGFASESRGNVKAVDEDASMAAVDAVGAEAAQNLVERDLNAGSVFEGG
jgi:hypothetical protein